MSFLDGWPPRHGDIRRDEWQTEVLYNALFAVDPEREAKRVGPFLYEVWRDIVVLWDENRGPWALRSHAVYGALNELDRFLGGKRRIGAYDADQGADHRVLDIGARLMRRARRQRLVTKVGWDWMIYLRNVISWWARGSGVTPQEP